MSYKIKIYGPPGTGKTTELLRCVHNELQAGVSPQQIIYTSFTRAAAHEARDRAVAMFQQEYNPDDFVWFSTIHSICYRLLNIGRESVFAGRQLEEFCKHHGYDISSGSEQLDDENEIHEQVLRTDADYFEYFINWQRNSMIDFNDAYMEFTRHTSVPDGFNIEQLKSYVSRRNEYKSDNRLWDFADMVEGVIQANKCPPDVKVMVSDECQDLTPLLVRVLDLWASQCERQYFAGDPYQCIYQWMAADPSIFINTKVDKTIVLKQSYRCPKEVHDLSRVIVDRFDQRYEDDDFIPRDNTGIITRNVASAIDWDSLGNKIFYLHRTHWLLNQSLMELLRDGIPFMTVKGVRSPLQTDKAGVVSSLLRLVNAKSISIAELVKVMDYLPTRTTQDEYLRQGAKAEAKRIMQEKPIKSVSLRDLRQLGFMEDFFRFFSPEGILQPLKMSIDEKAYFAKLVDNYGSAVLESEPRVVLSTIHGVKGRECDTVILNLNLTKKTYSALLDNPDAEHRLFYVGVTRSKNQVMLLEPDNYQSYRL